MTSARYLLDTDICIYVQHRRSIPAVARFATLRAGEAVMSTISFGELTFGAMKSRDATEAVSKLIDFAQLCPIVPLPVEAAERYGRTRAQLERTGRMIGANDLWIAAHTLASDLILVTNNEREFRRVDGLRVENWAVEP